MRGAFQREHAAKRAVLILSIAVLAVAGCALGAGSARSTPGYAKGVITAKGSIWVNGVEYDTRGASITMDDTGSHPESDLKVGMVVEVKGTIDSATGKGTAAEVQYDANLEGPIDTIDSATQSFSVFGQAIVTDTTTVYAGVSGFSALVPGSRVEVSGSADTTNQVIRAARIELKSTVTNEIKGIVSGLGARSFTLTPRQAAMGITVNFIGTLAAGIVDGSFVEVKFATYSSRISTTADQVKPLMDLEPSDKDRAEVHGVVRNFASGAGSSTFTVGEANVSADDTLLPPNFANRVGVEVKGTMSSGVLIAQSVRADRKSNLLLGGTVSAVDAGAGTVTLDGVTLAAKATTIFVDRSSGMPVSSFSIANISVGDYIDACGYTDPSVSPSVGVATRIIRLAPLPGALIAGPVSAAATTSLTILGIDVDITSATFRDANGITVTSAAFVGLITPGTTLAGATGTWNGPVFTATSAKIGEREE